MLRIPIWLGASKTIKGFKIMRKVVCFILLSVILISCAPMPLIIDDRLSYGSYRTIKNELGRHEKINLEIDKNTENLVVLQRPSGFIAGGVVFSLAIGKTFSAYLYQMSEAVFIEDCNNCLSVKVKIIDCKVVFYSSALAMMASRRVIDNFEMNTNIEVSYIKDSEIVAVKKYNYLLKRELSLSETDAAHEDTAIIFVIENTVKRLIQDIIKEQESINLL